MSVIQKHHIKNIFLVMHHQMCAQAQVKFMEMRFQLVYKLVCLHLTACIITILHLTKYGISFTGKLQTPPSPEHVL